MLRIMGLHSLVYCSRLFYYEELEQVYFQDTSIFEGRSHHLLRSEQGSPFLKHLDLEDQDLGLYGRCDALVVDEGEWIPLEYKRGRARETIDEPSAWEGDELQVAAYALLIEKEYLCKVTRGRVDLRSQDSMLMSKGK